ncbi:hypothetical protein SHIRM173S_11108 [Streptomyces hirsutus]
MLSGLTLPPGPDVRRQGLADPHPRSRETLPLSPRRQVRPAGCLRGDKFRKGDGNPAPRPLSLRSAPT